MTTVQAEPSFRRAVIRMTATSFLVPAAGVLTAPIPARVMDVRARDLLLVRGSEVIRGWHEATRLARRFGPSPQSGRHSG